MICRKCGNKGVHNIVLGKEFYYCRTCKEEIKATSVEEVEDELASIELDPWLPPPQSGTTVHTGQNTLGSYTVYTCSDCNEVIWHIQGKGVMNTHRPSCPQLGGSQGPASFYSILPHDTHSISAPYGTYLCPSLITPNNFAQLSLFSHEDDEAEEQEKLVNEAEKQTAPTTPSEEVPQQEPEPFQIDDEFFSDSKIINKGHDL